MLPNGPAIKCVNVGERTQAGAGEIQESRVLVPAGVSEPRRGFCRHLGSFLSHTSVAVHRVL
jgi:hypothetical protein